MHKLENLIAKSAAIGHEARLFVPFNATSGVNAKPFFFLIKNYSAGARAKSRTKSAKLRNVEKNLSQVNFN